MNQNVVLLFNCGRNLIEFALYTLSNEQEILRGKIEPVGGMISQVSYTLKKTQSKKEYYSVENIASGIKVIQNIIVQNFGKEMLQQICCCVHRVVHGGEKYFTAVEVTPQVQVDITEYYKLAPLHNPFNLSGIIESGKVFPKVKQIACFDTAFHQSMPEVHKRYPLPERFYVQYQIKKYGFHGLSHENVLLETARILKKKPAQINIISIHLGMGASICAIKNGKSIDVSMGFTPTGGLMMTTRCGDIDPEIPIYLQKEGCSRTEVEDVLLRESGLLGVAQKSFVKDIIDNYAKDERCTLAVDMYVYRIKKYIGSYYVLLNGDVDAIGFTGNVATEFPLLRQKVAEELKCLGVKIDLQKNKSLYTNGIFSRKESKIKLIQVVPNEFFIMLRQAKELLSKK